MQKNKKTEPLSVLILGGTKGIGLSIAKAFLNEGNIVNIISRNEAPLLFRHLNKLYLNRVFMYKCDVTDIDKLTIVRRKILNNSSDKIDVVICNVGNGSGSSLAIQETKEWNTSWNINFTSTYNATKVFSEDLVKTYGNIIFISSIAGCEFIGAPVSYSVAKSSIIAYAKSLSHKLSPNVRVNVIAPGNIMIKDGVWDLKQKKNPEIIKKMLNDKVPLKRFGRPEEVADLVLFISSSKASFITGGCFIIDGGQTVKF